MVTSYNGWTASPDRHAIGIAPLVVDGVEFVPGVRAGDVATVLGYVAQQVNDRVEKAVNPGCWGYFYRTNRNASNLSNHSSGTAIDFNAPKHPNGVPTLRTWSQRQVDEIHRILAEVDGVVTWGGDYHHTVDSMHFEISGSPALVARVARKIRAGHLTTATQEEDVTPQDIEKVADRVVEKLLAAEIRNVTPGGETRRPHLASMITNIELTGDRQNQRLAKILDRLEAIEKRLDAAGK